MGETLTIGSSAGTSFTDPLKDASVLYVEDDPEISEPLALVLRRRVGELYLAANGREGLEAWRRLRPDIIVTDIMMPVMDGMEMVAAIREEDDSIPIIITTAHNESDFFLRAIDLGVDKYVVKPVDTRNLVRAMERCAWEVKIGLEMRLAGAVFNTSSNAIIITDAGNRIIAVNPAFCRITGYSAEEVIGEGPSILSSGRQGKEFYDDMWRSLREKGQWVGEIWNRRKDGEFYAEWLTINTVRNGVGEVTHYVAIFSDITRHKMVEEHVHHLAHYDVLTDLPNRTLFNDRLGQVLAHARRNRCRSAVMFVDLDRFKQINDTLGHGVGDLLLQEAAMRLKGCVREGDTIARLGGDEFVVLLPEIRDTDDAHSVAHKLLAALSHPFDIQGHELRVSGSIGISFYPDDGISAGVLMKHADIAMYRAKELGRNNYQLFHADMNSGAFEQLAIEQSIHQALERGEFELYYQPRYLDQGGRIAGMEALIRWHHPELGLVPPGQFIPLAESTGAIIQIGEWVLTTAAAQGAAWIREGLPPVSISVNVSARQFRQADFAEQVRAIVDRTGFDPHHLELELTETTLMSHSDENIDTMKKLKSFGIRIAIDDFGTGYSSLSYLRRLPVDILKIDRSFIGELKAAGGGEDGVIVDAIMAMADSLGLRIVAEGVETELQRDYLRGRKCNEMQGFLLSHPLKAEEAGRLLGCCREPGKMKDHRF